MRKTVTCKKARETKGAIQYQQVNSRGEPVKRDRDGQIVGNVYLRKAAISGKIPNQISVTVEF